MKNIVRLVVAASLVAVIWGQTNPVQTKTQTTSRPGQKAQDEFVRAYRIGPEDVLQISVFEVPDLTQKVVVSQDGSILLNLLGRVEIGGLTQEEVVQKLTQLLQGRYVKNPQVTVFIEEYKSQQVSVMGAVQNPASYPLIGRKNLLQVLSMAGGLTDQAGNRISIIREGQNGNSTTITIDYNELVSGNGELNVPIEPKDVINVPPDKDIRVYVSGRVNEPGTVTAKTSQGLTLMQAIAGARGLAQGAKQSAIMIKRVDASGQEVRFKVNLKDIIKGKKKDIKLQDGDVVHVPESFW